MAEIRVDVRNIDGPKKCAVSSSKIASLEIGDESPGSTSESAFHGFFLNDQVSRNDVGNCGNFFCGRERDILIHSPSSLSTTICDKRPFDKIKSHDNVDIDLLNLLNSSKCKEVSKSGIEHFNSNENTSEDKMKTISNMSDGLSDLLSSISLKTPRKDDANSTSEYRQIKNKQDCDMYLDFDFTKNESSCSLSCSNSSLKADGNLSELLSSINIDDYDVTKNGSIDSGNVCSSNVTNKLKVDKESCIPDLSDLLSTLDFGDSNKDRINNRYQDGTNDVETNNKSCLSDLLSSIDIENPSKATLNNEPILTNLSDLLSSIDLGDSNDVKVHKCSLSNMGVSKGVKVKNGLSVPDILPSVQFDGLAPSLINSELLNCGNSNLDFKNIKDASNPLNICPCNVQPYSSSSGSCTSSDSEAAGNSPEDSLAKDSLLTDKILVTDSGYNSFDSAPKEFSFFDYTSDNQVSFNKLLTKKSDAIINAKQCDYKDVKKTNEEISMSDLLTIVSPDFKTPFLTTFNEDNVKSSSNEDISSVFDLKDSLNIKSKCYNHQGITNNLIEYNEKLMNCDYTDEGIVEDAQSTMKNNFQTDNSFLDISIHTNDENHDSVASDNEQITFIDLRECIKSAKHQLSCTSPIKQAKSPINQSSIISSPNKALFYGLEKSSSDKFQHKSNPFELINAVTTKKSRVNINQTMFSKALACKPKKDLSRLQKVSDIKNELLKSIINRPVLIDCDVPQSITEPVLQSDRCIITNEGKLSFGRYSQLEIK